MDIFTALQTAVTGLKAQSYAIGNISGNIANSQTTGYKRIDTSFVDLIAEQTPKHEVAGTVLAQAQLTNTLQGNITATNVSTNMAINGDGFFVVQKKTGDANGQPSFSGANLYTRRGDFTVDKDGYLVNGAGGYLQGENLDPVTGQVTTTGPVKVSNATLPARPTTEITYTANLPKTPITANSPTTGSALYTPPAAITPSPVVTTVDGTRTDGLQIPAANAADFISNSIAGPSLTVYTESGAPLSLTTRWAKISNATAATATTPAQPAVWNLYYANTSSGTGSSTAWTNAGTGFGFDLAGQAVPTMAAKVTIANLTVDGTSLGNVVVNIGKNGLTEYSDATGKTTTNILSQNGYTKGDLNSVAVTADGKIVGNYSNGSALPIATVGLVRFVNPDGLKPESEGNYQQTIDSGVPLTGLQGSTVVGGNVEQSNTDIAGEFSKMIVTQQAYSANTRVMSTAQQMMSDLLNVIR